MYLSLALFPTDHEKTFNCRAGNVYVVKSYDCILNLWFTTAWHTP